MRDVKTADVTPRLRKAMASLDEREEVELRVVLADATELASLFVAAGFFCPREGLKISAGRCK